MSEVEACYRGSDGERTRALYARLTEVGPAGLVAVNLLRACKNSERAKQYKSRRSSGAAYGTKDWAIGQLVDVLVQHAGALGIVWGWGRDEKAINFENVLYVEVPGAGQISFHVAYRREGTDYRGQWDGMKDVAAGRVIRYANAVLGIEQPPAEEKHDGLPTGTEGTAAQGAARAEVRAEGQQEALDL